MDWVESLTAGIDDDQAKKARRFRLLVDNGVRPEDAAIVDAAFMTVTREIAIVIGKAFNDLAPYLYPVALPYIMRGLVVNVEDLEDQINGELRAFAMEKGLASVIVDDGTPPTPGCDCEVCMVKRLNRSMGEKPTRH